MGQACEYSKYNKIDNPEAEIIYYRHAIDDGIINNIITVLNDN